MNKRVSRNVRSVDCIPCGKPASNLAAGPWCIFHNPVLLVCYRWGEMWMNNKVVTWNNLICKHLREELHLIVHFIDNILIPLTVSRRRTTFRASLHTYCISSLKLFSETFGQRNMVKAKTDIPLTLLSLTSSNIGLQRYFTICSIKYDQHFSCTRERWYFAMNTR